jgi:hypothetical protein
MNKLFENWNKYIKENTLNIPTGMMTEPSQVFRGDSAANFDHVSAYEKEEMIVPRPGSYATNNGYIAAVDAQGNVYVYVPGSPQHQKTRTHKFEDVINRLQRDGFIEASFYVPGSTAKL